jgi:CSLREA domain-containing protein
MANRSRRRACAPKHLTPNRTDSHGGDRQFARRLALESLEDRHLLSITVTTLADENNGVGLGAGTSLREAIAAAPAGETIDFAVAGTINLALGQLTIGQDLTVAGPGANLLTINAGGASRVLEIAGGTVNVSGLTLTGGSAPDGGGVRNLAGAVSTLSGMSIHGNTATAAQYDAGGGVRNSGTLTITGSTISGNQAPLGGGGGVSNRTASLTVRQSTISGNSAANGGGVLNYYGSATISNSTLTGNSATSYGGGLRNGFSASSTLSHTIVAGNSATNGREIQRVGGSVNLNGFNLLGDSGKTTAQALANVTAGATDFLATSNGAAPTALAAILAPLADNGGPTRTHALAAGSPAINAGNPAFTPPPESDQRGAPFVRVFGGRVDIGAYERSYVVDTLVDESDGNFSAGDFSLREAIELANANADADAITFAVTGTINLASQLPTITKAVSIIGPGANQLTIDAGDGADGVFATHDGYRLFNIDDGNLGTRIAVTLSGLTLTGGDTPNGHRFSSGGGAIRSRENLSIVGLVVTANATGAGAAGGTGGDWGGSGGGIANSGGNLTIASSTISGNRTGDGHEGTTSGGRGGGGGGVYNSVALNGITPVGGVLTITDSTISGNATGIGGHAINTGGGRGGSGGGVYNVGGDVTILRSTLSGSTTGGGGTSGFLGGSGGYGAGVFSQFFGIQGSPDYSRGSLLLEHATISNNATGAGGIGSGVNGQRGPGGGVFHQNLDLAIRHSTITGNSARLGGGVAQRQFNNVGVSVYSATTTLSHAIVAGNSADSGRELGNLTGLGTFVLNDFNLLGDSSQTTAQALAGATAGATDILATSNGTAPTALAAILAPLADNGGPTPTHALMIGSPARDAGNPAAVAGAGNVPLVDQRGSNFPRLAGGRIDIGAVEATPPSADFDADGDVDGNDFLLWQRGLGKLAPDATKSDGDADNDQDVDALDLAIWRMQFTPDPMLLAAAEQAPAVLRADALDDDTTAEAVRSQPLTSDLVDAAMALALQPQQSTPNRRLPFRPIPLSP